LFPRLGWRRFCSPEILGEILGQIVEAHANPNSPRRFQKEGHPPLPVRPQHFIGN